MTRSSMPRASATCRRIRFSHGRCQHDFSSIGSCSKAFVAVQVAMLADQQKLCLAPPPQKAPALFWDVRSLGKRGIQVEDLLCHRSGLTAYSLFPTLFLGYPPPTQVGGIRFKQPITSFRTTFAYQNHMYVAASELVAAKTGQTWNDNLADNDFQAAGNDPQLHYSG